MNFVLPHSLSGMGRRPVLQPIQRLSDRRSHGILALGLGIGLAMLAGRPALARSSLPDASDRFTLCGTYCGLVDGTGARVTDRVFEKLEDFNGSVAIYTHNGKQGAIDRSGKRIIKPVHDNLWSPVEGMIVAEDQSASGSGDGGGQSTYTLFDARGTELLHVTGDYRFQAWRGRLYYQSYCPEKQVCPTTFLDGVGKEVARFTYFNGRDSDPLAVASTGDKHYGFVDTTLRFVIAPRYAFVQNFERDVAIANTAAGPILIDRTGRELTRAGRYKSLYPSAKTPLITAFAADQPECPVFLRQNGKPIHLPKGICADDADGFDTLGYAFVHDGERRRGIIDARGRLLIRPTYPRLDALDDHHLVFGDDAVKPKNVGIVDLHGKQILPSAPLRIYAPSAGCCSGPRKLRSALIAGSPDGKTGLLGLDGRWIIPARYREGKVLSPDIVVMRDGDNHYSFFTATGQKKPLESSIDPMPLSPRSDEAGPFFFWRDNADRGSRASYKGVADTTGHILIPADYTKIDDAGEDLLALWAPGPEKIGFADRVGHIIAKPQFTELVRPFRNGAAVVSDRQGQTILLGADGRTIANFARLFPEIAANGGGNDQVDQALDICIDPDPTAEPEGKPSQTPAARKICGETALRAQSRETEKAWRTAQTDDCLPDRFLALRPAYDRALADCADAACLNEAMRFFRQQIAETARRCAVSAAPAASRRAIPASLRAQLRKRLIAEGAGEDIDPGADGQVSIDFQSIALGQRQAVLAIGGGGAHNVPLWLFLRNSAGGWDEIFAGDGGYLRPLEVTSALRHGLPVLRTQQHVSCCEHAVGYYAYDGRDFKLTRSCTQLYDADETPLLFCEDEREGEKARDE